jgi:hypothetical protein
MKTTIFPKLTSTNTVEKKTNKNKPTIGQLIFQHQENYLRKDENPNLNEKIIIRPLLQPQKQPVNFEKQAEIKLVQRQNQHIQKEIIELPILYKLYQQYILKQKASKK